MRVFLILIAAAFAGNANAQALDCAALRSGDRPFEIAYAQVPLADDSPSVLVEQTFRGADGSVRRLRRSPAQPANVLVSYLRYAFGGRFEAYSANGVTVSEIGIEGVDFSSDPFGRRQDLTYVRSIRAGDPPARVEHATARYVGDESIAVGGCRFPVVVYDIERRAAEPRPGEPAMSAETFWYSTELRALLRFSVRLPRPFDLAAHRLTVDVAPFR